MQDNRVFKSTFEKRLELINAVLDSNFVGSTDEWLEKTCALKLEDLTEADIERLLNEIKANKPNEG